MVDKSQRESIELPVIDPNIWNKLTDDVLELMWSSDEEPIKHTKGSFYVPAMLAFYGWQLKKDSLCKLFDVMFHIDCHDWCRTIPISIFITDKGTIQQWEKNIELSKNETKGDIRGTDLIDWLKPKSKFVFHPLNDHMNFCPILKYHEFDGITSKYFW